MSRTGLTVRGTDGLEQIEKPSCSGVGSVAVCARPACGTASAMSAQTNAAIASGRRAGDLGIAGLQLGMKRSERRAHETRDLPLCPDTTGIEAVRNLRLSDRQELMHLPDVLDLQS